MKSAQGFKIDPVTKDYVMVGGSPVNDPSITHPVYFRLMVQRTRWMYAPNDRYGSDFWMEKNKNYVAKPTVLEACADRALQPLIDDGRATSVTNTLASRSRNAIGLQCDIVDSQGEPQTIDLPSIGV